MTPSQAHAVSEAFKAMEKAGFDPAKLARDVIPDAPQLTLPAPSKAYKPTHGGYPGV